MTANPPYDACAILPPGRVLDRASQDALVAAYAAAGAPLTEAQIEAAIGPGLPPPTFLRRLPDSNPPGRGAPWTSDR